MKELIILGASTRAAAFSALRAGFQPWCIDLFADRDLAASATITQLASADYPQGFIVLIRAHAPHAPVIYTGGLENHPQIYTELAKLRPVWGYLHPQPFTATDSIRNPQSLSACCAKAGLARPLTVENSANVPRDGTWLCKPRSGAGGRNIAPWIGQPLLHPEQFFFQQLQLGTSLAAAYVNTSEQTFILGLTQQLIGTSFLRASRTFSYCGSMGPWPCHSGTTLFDQCNQIGNALARFDPYLRGLFGVDLIWDGKLAHVIEVNPRYTASLELLEWAYPEMPTLQLHAQAFGTALPKPSTYHLYTKQINTKLIGKAIYFAPRRLVFPDHGPWEPVLAINPCDMPAFADVPVAGSIIEKGQPVLTFFATDNDEKPLEQQLQKVAKKMDDLFFATSSKRINSTTKTPRSTKHTKGNS